MISIPIKIVNGSTYYITVFPETEYTSLATKTQDYKTVTNIINFTLTTISPNDITVSDLKAFRINGRTDTLTMGVGSTSVEGPISKNPDFAGDPSFNTAPNPVAIKSTHYYYKVTSHKTTTTWKITYDAFTGNDLANIGVLLKKLIQHAHTHKAYTDAPKTTSIRSSLIPVCCNSAVIW